MGPKKDLTSKIEQLEAFEERAGVEITSCSAFIEDFTGRDGTYLLLVHGELHPATGTTLQNDIWLCMAVYDTDDRVITKSARPYESKEFFGFEVFSFDDEVPVDISKIRIYPTTR